MNQDNDPVVEAWRRCTTCGTRRPVLLNVAVVTGGWDWTLAIWCFRCDGVRVHRYVQLATIYKEQR
jgi:hypothetical protein